MKTDKWIEEKYGRFYLNSRMIVDEERGIYGYHTLPLGDDHEYVKKLVNQGVRFGKENK